MIGPMRKVSASMLTAGRALFKSPIVEGMPGAFIDLMADPSERCERLWAQASDATGLQYVADTEGEPSALTEPAGRSLAVASRRLTAAANRSRQRVQTTGQPVGSWPPSAWESVAPLHAQDVAAEMQSIEAPEHSRTATPITRALTRGSSATLPSQALWRRDETELDASQPDHRRSLSFPATGEDIRDRSQLAAVVAGRQNPTPHEKRWDTPEAGETLPSPRAELRQPAGPTTTRMAKSFSDIGRILGSNLQREDNFSSPIASASLDASQLISFPGRRSPTFAREPQTLDRPHFENDPKSVASPHPTPDMQSIFEELEQRLKLEYLRTYGTSGGL